MSKTITTGHKVETKRAKMSVVMYTYTDYNDVSITGTIDELVEKTGKSKDSMRSLSVKSGKRHAEIKVTMKDTGFVKRGNMQEVADFAGVGENYIRKLIVANATESAKFTIALTGRSIIMLDDSYAQHFKERKKPKAGYVSKKVKHGLRPVKMGKYWEDMLTDMFAKW